MVIELDKEIIECFMISMTPFLLWTSLKLQTEKIFISSNYLF
jgi:hypothetical protein